MKGAQTVFLYRFMKFMKKNRGNGDLMKWMTRFQIDGRRLAESWMDLLPDLDLMSPVVQAEVTIQRQAHNAQQAAMQAADDQHVLEPWTDALEQVIYDEAIRLHKQAHRDLFPLFPLSQNLIALIFISTADLSQDQRQSLTSIMTRRNMTMDQYRAMELREVFIELFCTVKTAVDNPMMNPSGSGGRKGFLVLDEGELEGSLGYWAEDEEDGAEGFLDALEDVFWIWDDNHYSWYSIREDSKGEEPEKEKEKEEKEKDDKVEDFSDLETKAKEKEREKEKVTLQEMRVIGLKMNGKEMRQRIGTKAIGPMKMKQHGNPKPGMNGKKIIRMNTDISKEKERKERKEKGKERKVMDLKIKEKDKVIGN